VSAPKPAVSWGPIYLAPITLKQAEPFVRVVHRHLPPPQGGRFAIALKREDELVGVAIVGNPARMLQDGYTAVVTRVAVIEGVPNANSMLYGACWRAWRAMGGRRLYTYTLPGEPGTSLKAAGWELIGQTTGGPWSRPSRHREDDFPLVKKNRWRMVA
jgi:hypothetical protein